MNSRKQEHDNDFRDALIFCAIQKISLTHGKSIIVSSDGAFRKTVIEELNLDVGKDGIKLIIKLFDEDGTQIKNPRA